MERWFAERAEVDLRVGGAFRLWGRHTPGLPGAGEADQVITAIDAPHLLAFRWRIGGAPSDLSIRLAPVTGAAPPATEVAVRHVVPGLLSGSRPRELVDDVWRLSIGNLAAHLAGGAGMLRPDFGDPSPEIRLSILIEAPRAAVWRALIEPDLMNLGRLKETAVAGPVSVIGGA